MLDRLGDKMQSVYETYISASQRSVWWQNTAWKQDGL